MSLFCLTQGQGHCSQSLDSQYQSIYPWRVHRLWAQGLVLPPSHEHLVPVSTFRFHDGLCILECKGLEVIHSFIPDISIAPLQVHYYSEALPATALILCRSQHAKVLHAIVSEGVAHGPYITSHTFYRRLITILLAEVGSACR